MFIIGVRNLTLSYFKTLPLSFNFILALSYSSVGYVNPVTEVIFSSYNPFDFYEETVTIPFTVDVSKYLYIP